MATRFIFPLFTVVAIAYLTQLNAVSVFAEISIGELIDKITILKIKKMRITDAKKLQNICTELETLKKTFFEHIENSSILDSLIDELQRANETLWDIEDALREKEQKQKFDPEFIELARSVYFTNDKRAQLKYEINRLLNSHIVEEKSYKSYDSTKRK